MKKSGFSRVAITLVKDLKVSFRFESFFVRTVDEKEFLRLFPQRKLDDLPPIPFDVKLPPKKSRIAPFGFLIIEALCELEMYDSLNEAAAHERPQLLVILGLLTLFTDTVFSPIDIHSSYRRDIENMPEIENSKHELILEGQDYSNCLQTILEQIEDADTSKRKLIFSLLERWRKALFLEHESEENQIYTDEALLAYFHILETLAIQREFTHELKQKVDLEKEAIKELLKEAKIDTPALNSQVNRMEVRLKDKIYKMLETLSLYNDKSKAIIERFYNYRNEIAHGKIDLYRSKVIYPLKSFFPMVEDVDLDLFAIKILSARVISSYLKTDLWQNDYDYAQHIEHPSIDAVRAFVEGKKYKAISIEEFITGKCGDITPDTLCHYYLKNKWFRKKSAEVLEILAGVVLACELQQLSVDNALDYFNSALILADYEGSEISTKARQIIDLIDTNDLVEYSNRRDVLKYYEYHGINFDWFKEWLNAK